MKYIFTPLERHAVILAILDGKHVEGLFKQSRPGATYCWAKLHTQNVHVFLGSAEAEFRRVDEDKGPPFEMTARTREAIATTYRIALKRRTNELEAARQGCALVLEGFDRAQAQIRDLSRLEIKTHEELRDTKAKLTRVEGYNKALLQQVGDIGHEFNALKSTLATTITDRDMYQKETDGLRDLARHLRSGSDRLSSLAAWYDSPDKGRYAMHAVGPGQFQIPMGLGMVTVRTQ